MKWKCRPECSKVHALIRERFDKLYNSHGRPWHETQFMQVSKEWTSICSNIGICRVGIFRVENESAKNDNILFEDPCGSTRWSNSTGTGEFVPGGLLEMSEETLMKILVLGLP